MLISQAGHILWVRKFRDEVRTAKTEASLGLAEEINLNRKKRGKAALEEQGG